MTYEMAYDVMGESVPAWRDTNGTLYFRVDGYYVNAEESLHNQADAWEMKTRNGHAKIGDIVSVWNGQRNIRVKIDSVQPPDAAGRYSFSSASGTFRAFPEQITKVTL